jgi:hypothetical protein
MPSDRRAHARHPVRLLVQHQAGERTPVVDYATDVSRGGLFVRTRHLPGRDETVHVQFAPAKDARTVEAFCRVARVTEEGFGAAFVALDDGAQGLLAQMFG